jgi:hypothetical protein
MIHRFLDHGQHRRRANQAMFGTDKPALRGWSVLAASSVSARSLAATQELGAKCE